MFILGTIWYLSCVYSYAVEHTLKYKNEISVEHAFIALKRSVLEYTTIIGFCYNNPLTVCGILQEVKSLKIKKYVYGA